MTKSVHHWSVRLATLNLPANVSAPGTLGALWVCSSLWVLEALNLFPGLNLAATGYPVWLPVSALIMAFPVIQRALPYFAQKDPALICLDEVVGMLVSLCAIPLNWQMIVLGFMLFRFFDILKPAGIKILEQLPGAWGVLADDLLAGLYTNLLLQALRHYHF